MANMGMLLREARKGSGLTLRQLADMTGVHHTTISSIENGKVNPSLDALERLFGALGYELTVKRVCEQ